MKEAEEEGKQEVKQPLIRRRRLRKCRNNSSSLSQCVAGPCEAFIITELHKCQRSFHPLLLRKSPAAQRKRAHGIFFYSKFTFLPSGILWSITTLTEKPESDRAYRLQMGWFMQKLKLASQVKAARTGLRTQKYTKVSVKRGCWDNLSLKEHKDLIQRLCIWSFLKPWTTTISHFHLEPTPKATQESQSMQVSMRETFQLAVQNSIWKAATSGTTIQQLQSLKMFV